MYDLQYVASGVIGVVTHVCVCRGDEASLCQVLYSGGVRDVCSSVIERVSIEGEVQVTEESRSWEMPAAGDLPPADLQAVAQSATDRGQTSRNLERAPFASSATFELSQPRHAPRRMTPTFTLREINATQQGSLFDLFAAVDAHQLVDLPAKRPHQRPAVVTAMAVMMHALPPAAGLPEPGTPAAGDHHSVYLVFTAIKPLSIFCSS